VRGLFVTGTDTGVGKSILSACLLAAMRAAGEPVRAYKPVVTGLDEPEASGESGGWPPDHELLGAAAGMQPEDVSPLRFGPAVSPHLAAEMAGRSIEPAEMVAAARQRARTGTLVVEGVGGLMVPLTPTYTVLDFALDLELPLVIAARPGLGTINHTLLSLQATRARGLDVRAVVLTPWPATPAVMERSNREAIERLGAVGVETLGYIGSPEAERLENAGAQLPWREWLEAR
jgi:dethiobiotin synthetase